MQLLDDIRLVAPPPEGVRGGAAQVFGIAGIRQYFYWIIAHYPIGITVSGPFPVRNGPNTLSPINYILIVWDAALGADHYDVLRTQTADFPNDPGNYAVALDVHEIFAEDHGLPLSFYDPRGLPWGAPVARQIHLNNRDYVQPTLVIDTQLAIPQIIFPDGSIQIVAGVPGPDVPQDGICYGREDEHWEPAVRLSGDTMTGPLVLSEEPVAPFQAATKEYVDAQAFGSEAPINGMAYGRENAAWVPVMPLAGGTMTGPLILTGNPNVPQEAATKQYVDQRFTGAVHFIGTIDAATGDCIYTTDSGFANGPVVLAATAPNGYLIATVAGTIPGGPAAGIAMQPGDWLLSDGITWTDIPVGEPAIDATQVGLAPSAFGGANVQDALNNAEVAVNEKVSKTGDTMTGSLSVLFDNLVIAGVQVINTTGPAIACVGSISITSGGLAGDPTRSYQIQLKTATGGRPQWITSTSDVGGGGGITSEAINFWTNDHNGSIWPGNATWCGKFSAGGVILPAGSSQRPALLIGGSALTPQPSTGGVWAEAPYGNPPGSVLKTNSGITTARPQPGNYWNQQNLIVEHANPDGSATTTSGDAGIALYNYNTPEHGGQRKHCIVLDRNSDTFLFRQGDPPFGLVNISANTVTANVFNNTSDIALKEDIIEPAMIEFSALFAGLRPRKFRRKSELERIEYGLIAQEVESSVPHAVHVGADGLKGYSVTDVLAIAIGKIRHDEARIRELEQARLSARMERFGQTAAAVFLAATQWVRSNLSLW